MAAPHVTGVFALLAQQEPTLCPSQYVDALLERAALQLEQDVSQHVAALARLVEPGVMVVLGGLVGGLVVALYLPLFQLGQVL